MKTGIWKSHVDSQIPLFSLNIIFCVVWMASGQNSSDCLLVNDLENPRLIYLLISQASISPLWLITNDSDENSLKQKHFFHQPIYQIDVYPKDE